MKVALCDDDNKERDRLVSFFIEYSLQTGIAFQVQHFENGFYLLDAIEKDNHFDVIILDILMPGMNGIQTAKTDSSIQRGGKNHLLNFILRIRSGQLCRGGLILSAQTGGKDEFFRNFTTLSSYFQAKGRREHHPPRWQKLEADSSCGLGSL